MWRGLAFSVVAIIWQVACPVRIAYAQNGDIDCNSFSKNPDGSWTVIHKAFIPVQNVRVIEGTVFRPGETFLGDDMAARLQKACPNQPLATPQEPAQEAEPLVPHVPLSRYADANGNIDAKRLTCGHLSDASTEESDLFLAWFSGWYSGQAKKRGINLAQVRFALRNVSSYCKANRDKRLADVMELMLR